MSLKRSFAITKRIFRGLRHDPRTVALIVVAPILAMTLFGIAFSGEVEDVDVVVVNLDNGELSHKVIANLDTKTLNIHTEPDQSTAVKKVEDGDAWAAIIFPEDFSRNIIARMQNGSTTGDTAILLMADKSNVNVASAIAATVRDALRETISGMGGELTIELKESPVYGENAKFIDFFVPGIMAFAVFILTTILTLLAFVGERTRGTLERLKASPMRESEIVAGYAIAFGIIGMFQASLLLIVGTVGFDITIVGNPFQAYLIVALLAMVSVSLGILLSSAAKREAQAVQFLPLIIMPTFLLSGIFWPLEAIPHFLRWASYLIPPTYGVEAMRSVIVRGWNIGDIWMEILILLAFALVFLSMSVISLKRAKG